MRIYAGLAETPDNGARPLLKNLVLTWNAKPTMDIVVEFEKSLKKYPHISRAHPARTLCRSKSYLHDDQFADEVGLGAFRPRSAMRGPRAGLRDRPQTDCSRCRRRKEWALSGHNRPHARPCLSIAVALYSLASWLTAQAYGLSCHHQCTGRRRRTVKQNRLRFNLEVSCSKG